MLGSRVSFIPSISYPMYFHDLEPSEFWIRLDLRQTSKPIPHVISEWTKKTYGFDDWSFTKPEIIYLLRWSWQVSERVGWLKCHPLALFGKMAVEGCWRVELPRLLTMNFSSGASSSKLPKKLSSFFCFLVGIWAKRWSNTGKVEV